MPDETDETHPREQPGRQPPTSPSVSELIGWARRESQTLIATAGAAEATSLASGWPRALAAAQQLLEAIPYAGTDDEPHPVGQHYLSIQVAQMTTQAARFHPVAPAGHPVMSDVTATLDEAAQLVQRHTHAWLPTNPDARQDAAVARVQVAETLSNLAHVTGREIHSYTRMAQAADHANDSHGQLPRALRSQTAERWLRMLDNHEEVLLGYVRRHRGELHGQRHVPPVPASELGVQLAAWTATALRHVSNPHASAADLRQVADTQANLLWVATALTAAGGVDAQINPSVTAHLHRRLEAAGTQWASTAQQWQLLHTPSHGRDLGLLSQARALRTSLARVTHHPAGWYSPIEIAERLAGTPITPLLRSAAESSHALAEIYAQLPAEIHAAGGLRAPAAAQLAIARGGGDLSAAVTDYPRYREAVNQPGASGKPVSLIDIATNRLHRLTPNTLVQLNTNGNALVDAATTAYRAVLVNTTDPDTASSPPPPHAPMTPASQPHPHQPAFRPQPRSGITH